jgi:hypothetical protein
LRSPTSIAFVPVVEWPIGLEPPGTIDRGFVAVSDVPMGAIPLMIAQHLEPLTSRGESHELTCPFFGGLVLEVDARRVLYPQCCGDLSALSTWKAVLRPDFRRGLVASEGHPCPEVTRNGEQIEVCCAETDEPFRPPVEGRIIMSVAAVRSALAVATLTLEAFTTRIAACDPQRPHIARLLVFGVAG